MAFINAAQELVKTLNQKMGPSAYDIAWLARLQNLPHANGHWQGMRAWLLENQRPDGSWGGEIAYYHDRVICTLAALVALSEVSHVAESREAIQRGEAYLWKHFHLLHTDPFELVGFELLLPTLLDEALALGLQVPSQALGYREIRETKLQLIPSEKLYAPNLSTAHSLEFLGAHCDSQRLAGAQAGNGSLGNSPAATAYYLLKTGGEDPRALAYLEAVKKHSAPCIYLYPFRAFEETWVLNNLAYTGLPVTDFAGPEFWEKLASYVTAEGIGLDPEFGVPDGDLTSVGLQLLIKAGYPVDPHILQKFEDPQQHIFRTYPYERNASVSTNAHALDTLAVMPDYPGRQVVQAQVTAMLFEKRTEQFYWMDKWHASPYYATAHTLMALLRDEKNLEPCQPSLDWLLQTQREDGSWGFFQNGTAEETSYALLALLHFYQQRKFDPAGLRRGQQFLLQMLASTQRVPEFWIGKDLFAPYDIIRSAILAALILSEQVLGKSQ